MEKKHPRIRGENNKDGRMRGGLQETSPHTRGKLTVSPAATRWRRNIPAYAGKTILEDSRL